MPKDVIITPASGSIDFNDTAGNKDAYIQLDDLGNLKIINDGGQLTIGNTAADVYIGDGTNEVDIVFEQNGDVRALANKTLTLGQNTSFVRTASPFSFISPDGTQSVTVRALNTDVLSVEGNTTITGFINATTTAQFGGNLTLASTSAIIANSTAGTSGQTLTSNGSAVYWANVPPADMSVTYTWTNNHYYAVKGADIATINSTGIYLGPLSFVSGMRKNKRTINNNLTIYNGDNASLVGPIIISSGVTLTLEANTRFFIS